MHLGNNHLRKAAVPAHNMAGSSSFAFLLRNQRLYIKTRPKQKIVYETKEKHNISRLEF